MVYGKDYKKHISSRRQARIRKTRQRWLIRAFSLVAGISVIGVVLATTHQNLGQEETPAKPYKEASDDALAAVTTPIILAPAAAELSENAPSPQRLKAPEPEDPAWQQVTVKKGDTASSIFSELNIHSQLQALLSLPEAKEKLTHLVPGETFQCRIEDGKLQAIRYQENETKHVRFFKNKDTFEQEVTEDEVEIRVATSQGTIKDSLFLAAKDAGISDNLTMNLVDIFAYDIDYALDIRSGDQFKLIYEERYANGKRLKDGKILAAQFINKNKAYEALRYTPPSGNPAYYDADGRNLKKAFIRTPVKFSRISSHFNPNRMHPILHKIKAHRGVDYAAPKGTPVKATGVGKVAFVGTKRGYGKTIILQHGSRYSTLYAHLSGFKKGLRKGNKVSQGQVIGYVGMTGSATGPHLHYEFRINGVHKNPVTVKLPASPPLPKNQLEQFRAATRPLVAQLEAGRVLAQADSQ